MFDISLMNIPRLHKIYKLINKDIDMFLSLFHNINHRCYINGMYLMQFSKENVHDRVFFINCNICKLP